MFIKKDLSCLSHSCIAWGITVFESGFYTVLCNWDPLSSCLLQVYHNPFLWEMPCHRCQPGKGAEICTKPQAIFSLLLLLLLLYCTHFYPLIGNSIGGSTVLSVSPSSEWYDNHWPQMENASECLNPAYPIPQGVIHLQPGHPWSPLVHGWRIVFAHPEGSGDLSDDPRAAPGIPFLWPLWINQHNNFISCP